MRLSFQILQLKSCSALSSLVCRGRCDHLEVRDGTDGRSEELGRYCGNEYHPTFLSSGRYMWIKFESDSSDNEKGFLVKYTAVGM